MDPRRPVTDGLVTLRPPREEDVPVLIAGRDEVFHRFLGPGDDRPWPTACIVVAGEVVGWVDHDTDRPWLEPGEVNVGYNVFAAHRGRGIATRALQLLMHHLGVDTDVAVATLLIDPLNERSLALASRASFTRCGDLDVNPYFKRAVPSPALTDGSVTIRPQRAEDLDRDLEAKDDAQIDWLWLPGERSSWEAMTPTEQRAHALRTLTANADAFGRGPKWAFAVDAPDTPYVADIDCDLANDHVPAGEANISYSCHPDHRGRGYVSRAVRLVLRFLRESTGAREAHLVVDSENMLSHRVAAAVGASHAESWTDERGRTMIRSIRRI